MQKIFTILVLLLLHISVFAQFSPNVVEEDFYKDRRYALKITPLALFGPIYPTAEISFEHKVKNNLSLQYSAGYVLPFYMLALYVNGAITQHIGGFKLKAESRFYMPKPAMKQALFGGYFSIDLMYMEVYDPRSEWVDRDCADNDCGYTEQIEFTTIRRVFANHYKVGTQRNLSDNLVFDFYFGLGARLVFIRSPKLPSDAQHFDRFTSVASLINFNTNDATHLNSIYPSMVLGFKLGFMIN